MFCKYCGDDVGGTDALVKKHVAQCEKNPSVRAETKKRDKELKLRDGFEEIRLSAKSVDEIITRLVQCYKENGIEITFTEYPGRWSETVSNSHNTPKGYPSNWCGRGDDKGIPRGYPGWSGNWKGEIIKGTSKYFSDIKPQWLKTGTGGGGQNFRYDGMLFLYDFPEMYKEWEAEGGVIKQKCDAFNKSLTEIHSNHKKERDSFINADESVIEIKSKIEKMRLIQAQLDIFKNELIQNATKRFHEANPVNIPEISSAFISYQKLNEVQKYIEEGKSIKLTDVKASILKSEKLFKEVLEYYEAHPEIFI